MDQLTKSSPPQTKTADAAPKATRRVDKELEEFRSLMEAPGTFDDGFSWIALFGALFVALLMVPGAIYMTLIAGGQAIGPAAQWVTVILFIEVARRANKSLRKSEIFTLFYLAGAIMATASMAQGQFYGGLGGLWSQFFVQSDAARASGIASQIPWWVAPSDPAVLEQHSFFMWQWLPPLGLIAFTMIIGRIDNMILGYGLFRLTSDIEKLPFPMAPVGAQGILALSEEQEEESLRGREEELPDDNETPSEGKWRWRIFSIGSVMGLVFGAIYIGLPTVTAALLGKPIEIIPIPFVDFTAQTGQYSFLSADPIAASLDLTQVILGMVLPFWAVIGTFVGFLITCIVNPILYNFSFFGHHILSIWQPGDTIQKTFYENNIDFYFSFSLGVALAIAGVGIWSVVSRFREIRQRRRDEASTIKDSLYDAPKGRGDIRWWIIFAVYAISSLLYIGVSAFLLYITDGFVTWSVIIIMIFYAIFYTPVVSYVTARLEGIAGQVIAIPFVKEACFILSGYHGVAVWFLPVPYHNYGTMTVLYRQSELTGTKFWSIWKSEFFLIPIILGGSLIFANFIWGLGAVPGPAFPYAQTVWPVTAAQQSIIFSSTLGGFSLFEQVMNWHYIVAGLGIGSILFAVLSSLGAPTFLMYGIVRGLNQTLPFGIIPQFVGALIGRYYFQKKLGLKWRQYVPVVFAGFSCGMGLVGTLGIGFTFLAKSVFKLPY